MRGMVSAFVLACLACGCGLGAVRAARAAQRQHAALYGCAFGEVGITTVGPHTYAADGCGHRAIYVCRRGAVCDQRGEAQATTREADPGLQLERVAMQREEDAALEEQRGHIRATPQAPEVGGMWHEGEMLCTSQGAAFRPFMQGDGSGAMTCELAGRRLFSAHVDAETRRIDEVDVYLEGANVPELRERYTRDHGDPVERLDDAGRSWTWQTASGALVLRMYDRGARVTMRERVEPR